MKKTRHTTILINQKKNQRQSSSQRSHLRKQKALKTSQKTHAQ